jgi:secondary thiamine-phosphate synthase enzyme
MRLLHETWELRTRGPGTYEVTDRLCAAITRSGMVTGQATVFCPHTSASLVLMENADPTARADLESWFGRLVREADPHFRHTAEGPDDMPSHIRMALTRTSETIPFASGRPLLGTWQGLFLWEHRRTPHTRQLVLTLCGV